MAFDLNGKVVKHIRLPTSDYNGAPKNVVPAQEGDTNSRYFKIELYEDYGNINLDIYDEINLNATLPDGTIRSTECYKEGGYIYSKLSSAMLAVYGRLSCDISLFGVDGNNKKVFLTSQTFYVIVAKSQLGNDALEEDEHYNIFVRLVERVEGLENMLSLAELEREADENARRLAEQDRVLAEQTRQEEHGAAISRVNSLIGIESIEIAYLQTTSESEIPPVNGWSSAIPTPVQGQFIWTRTVINYSDGRSATSYCVSHQGKDAEFDIDDGIPVQPSSVNRILAVPKFGTKTKWLNPSADFLNCGCVIWSGAAREVKLNLKSIPQYMANDTIVFKVTCLSYVSQIGDPDLRDDVIVTYTVSYHRTTFEELPYLGEFMYEPDSHTRRWFTGVDNPERVFRLYASPVCDYYGNRVPDAIRIFHDSIPNNSILCIRAFVGSCRNGEEFSGGMYS